MLFCVVPKPASLSYTNADEYAVPFQSKVAGGKGGILFWKSIVPQAENKLFAMANAAGSLPVSNCLTLLSHPTTAFMVSQGIFSGNLQQVGELMCHLLGTKAETLLTQTQAQITTLKLAGHLVAAAVVVMYCKMWKQMAQKKIRVLRLPPNWRPL